MNLGTRFLGLEKLRNTKVDGGPVPMDKKRALIVFPDDWLQFSPSIMNLETCLREEGYQVEVVYTDVDLFDNDGLVEHGIPVQLIRKGFLAKALRVLNWYTYYRFFRLCSALWRIRLRRNKYDLVFGVDVLGYYVASLFYKNITFFSLELPKTDDVFLKRIQKARVSHLIVQTEERGSYLSNLFRVGPTSTSYIQNAPICEPRNAEVGERKRKDILYLGNINRGYSLESFIEAYSSLPDDYSLCLKGFGVNKSYLQELESRFAPLFASGRIRIVLDYIQQEDIVEFVSGFYMGIVGYDEELVNTDYNYESSPSGKLFNYFAGGVPVIGLNISGLHSVKDMDAGVLLQTVTPASFIQAIKDIEASYEVYASNCLKAAAYFDFRKGVKQFLQMIENSELQHA